MGRFIALFIILFFVNYNVGIAGTAETPETIEASPPVTDIEKTEYWTRSQEILRIEHNQKGASFVAKKITEKQWQEYLDKEFFPKSKMIHEALNNARKSLLTTITDTSLGETQGFTYDKESFKEAEKWDVDNSSLLDVSATD